MWSILITIHNMFKRSFICCGVKTRSIVISQHCWWPRFNNLAQIQILDQRLCSSRNDVMMSLLRLPTTPDCIPLSHYINWKRLNMLRCCGWAHGCILTVLRQNSGCECECKWCHDVMVEMSNPADCIRLSNYIYWKCLSTLRCCGWAHGDIFTG